MYIAGFLKLDFMSMQFNRGNIWRLLTSCGRLSSLAIAILAMCALASAAARAGSSVTLAMSLTPLSAPVIIAAEKGYFAAHGIDVGIKDYVGGMRTAKAMFEGKADMATSSEVVVMFNSFKRSDFSVICTFVTSDNDVKIVTRKDTGIRNVADLAGMTVGTVTGASAQFFLDETLFLAGVDGAEVDVIHVNPEDSSTTLASGKVDAVVIWEPLVYRIRRIHGVSTLYRPQRVTRCFMAMSHC